MSEKDFAVGVVGNQVMPGAIGTSGLSATGSAVSKKPCYLVILDEVVKGKPAQRFFVTLDKPDLLNGFVQVNGLYCKESEEFIVANFGELLRVKENIVDMLFPTHRVHSIRSLVFNANKQATLIKEGK